jgi:putative nucleotidyltransferase with HDIG domain
MYQNFTVPYFYEGWDKIELVYPDDASEYETSYMQELLDGSSELYRFDQKNHHHTLTLGKHLFECYKVVASLSENKILKEAALLHDIGKAKTQTFDEKGEAHYYQHHCVSGYESLFEKGCTSDAEKLLRAAYIQWHMQPYFCKEEKTKEKYKKLWGEDFYNEILLLHKGDLKAH